MEPRSGAEGGALALRARLRGGTALVVATACRSSHRADATAPAETEIACLTGGLRRAQQVIRGRTAVTLDRRVRQSVLIASTVDPSKRYTRSYHIFSHPPGRKTLSARATRRRPHSKPLVGQACSLDAGERIAHALDGGEAKNTDGGRPLACRTTQPIKHDKLGPQGGGGGRR